MEKVTIDLVLQEALAGPLGKINATFERFEKILDESSQSAREVDQSTARLRRGFRLLQSSVGSMVTAFDRLRRVLFNVRTLFATLIAGVAVRQVVGAAADIEKRILEVATLLGDVSDETITKLRRDLIDLAVEGGQAIQDEISAAYNAISAGVPQEQVLGFLRDANRLAVGGVTDVNTAVGLLTTTVRGYQLQFDDTVEVADSLFTTVRLGKTTISELAATIGRAAGPANALEISLDETGASLAILTTALGSTDRAVTAYLGVLRTLDKPTETARAIAERYGVELGLTNVRANGLVKTLNDLGKIAQSSPDDFRLLFEEVTAFNGALALTQDNGATFAATLEEFGEKTGAAEAAFDRLSGSLLTQLQSLRSSLIGLIDEVLDSQVRRLTSLVQDLTSTVQNLTRVVRAAEEGQINSDALSGAFAAGFNVLKTFGLALARAIGTTLVEASAIALTAATPLFQRLLRDIVAPVFNETIAKLPGIGEIDVGTTTRLSQTSKQLEELVSLLAEQESLNRKILELENELDASPLSYADDADERRNFIEPLRRQIAEGGKEIERILDELGVSSVDKAQNLLQNRTESLMRTLQIEAEDAARVFGEAYVDGFGASLEQFARINPEVRAALQDFNRAIEDVLPQSEEIFGPPLPEVVGDSAEANLPRVNRFKAAVDGIKEAYRFLNGETEFFQALQVRVLDAQGKTTEAARLSLLIRQREERNELEAAYGSQFRTLAPFLAEVQRLEVARFDANASIASQLTSVVDAEKAYRDALTLRNAQAEAGKIITAEQEANLRELENALRDAGQAAFQELNSIANEQGFGTIVIPALERIREILKGINEDASGVGTTFREGLIKAMQDLKEQSELTFEDAQKLINGVANSIADNLTNGIVGLIDGTMSFGDAFKSVAAGILRDIGTMILRMLIFKAVAGIIGGPFASLFAAQGGKADPKNLQYFNRGGKTFGPPPIGGRDNIPAMLQRGEWVIQPSASAYYGDSIMSAMNQRLVPREIFKGVSGSKKSFGTGPNFAQGGRAVQEAAAATQPSVAVVIPSDSSTQRFLSGGRQGVMAFMNEHASEIRRAIGI